MAGLLTEVTEIGTALGTLHWDPAAVLRSRPPQLANVSDEVWERVVGACADGGHGDAFARAFANGRALLAADDGLRWRPPRLVEWKGPHRPPGDDVVPADLRIDHVYQVSCKYLSRITVNAGPSRLFDRLLVGEERGGGDWFALTAPAEHQMFWAAVRDGLSMPDLPEHVDDLDRAARLRIKDELRGARLDGEVRAAWQHLSQAVSAASAARWSAQLGDPRRRLRVLWRLLRIGDAPYFVLGCDRGEPVRLRIASTWDWAQAFELRSFEVYPRAAGQPDVGWRAVCRERASGLERAVDGHVEVRWSHGRFQGAPEAKVYLDTPHLHVAGYHELR